MCANNLAEKLGPRPVAASTVLGPISSYMTERYGFDSDRCEVCAFTGDNASALIGVKARPGDICISLGTSDTVFVWIEENQSDGLKPQITGHIWPNPANQNDYMALLW